MGEGCFTKEEFKKLIEDAFKEQDTETAHASCDGFMCDLLRSLGYADGIEIFEAQEKWYA